MSLVLYHLVAMKKEKLIQTKKTTIIFKIHKNY